MNRAIQNEATVFLIVEATLIRQLTMNMQILLLFEPEKDANVGNVRSQNVVPTMHGMKRNKRLRRNTIIIVLRVV